MDNTLCSGLQLPEPNLFKDIYFSEDDMGTIDDCLRLASDPDYFYEFAVESAIRQAQLGEAMEDYLHELHKVPTEGAPQARYAREIREEADRLCREYGEDRIMPHFRKHLGQRFDLYFGNN